MGNAKEGLRRSSARAPDQPGRPGTAGDSGRQAPRTGSAAGEAQSTARKPGPKVYRTQRSADAAAIRTATAGKATDARIADRYPYRATDGSSFEVLRVEWTRQDGRRDKAPIPVRPVAGGWQLGRPAFKPLPFAPMDLAGAPFVVVVEGEKSVRALEWVGVPAATSIGGAGAAARTSWEPLADRYAIVWPDADEPGLRYAFQVGELLLALGCSVQRLGTPAGTPAGFDAADFVEALEAAGLGEEAIRARVLEHIRAQAFPWSAEGESWELAGGVFRITDAIRARVGDDLRPTLSAPRLAALRADIERLRPRRVLLDLGLDLATLADGTAETETYRRKGSESIRDLRRITRQVRAAVSNQIAGPNGPESVEEYFARWKWSTEQPKRLAVLPITPRDDLRGLNHPPARTIGEAADRCSKLIEDHGERSLSLSGPPGTAKSTASIRKSVADLVAKKARTSVHVVKSRRLAEQTAASAQREANAYPEDDRPEVLLRLGRTEEPGPWNCREYHRVPERAMLDEIVCVGCPARSACEIDGFRATVDKVHRAIGRSDRGSRPVLLATTDKAFAADDLSAPIPLAARVTFDDPQTALDVLARPIEVPQDEAIAFAEYLAAAAEDDITATDEASRTEAERSYLDLVEREPKERAAVARLRAAVSAGLVDDLSSLAAAWEEVSDVHELPNRSGAPVGRGYVARYLRGRVEAEEPQAALRFLAALRREIYAYPEALLTPHLRAISAAWVSIDPEKQLQQAAAAVPGSLRLALERDDIRPNRTPGGEHSWRWEAAQPGDDGARPKLTRKLLDVMRTMVLEGRRAIATREGRVRTLVFKSARMLERSQRGNVLIASVGGMAAQDAETFGIDHRRVEANPEHHRYYALAMDRGFDERTGAPILNQLAAGKAKKDSPSGGNLFLEALMRAVATKIARDGAIHIGPARAGARQVYAGLRMKPAKALREDSTVDGAIHLDYHGSPTAVGMDTFSDCRIGFIANHNLRPSTIHHRARISNAIAGKPEPARGVLRELRRWDESADPVLVTVPADPRAREEADIHRLQTVINAAGRPRPMQHTADQPGATVFLGVPPQDLGVPVEVLGLDELLAALELRDLFEMPNRSEALRAANERRVLEAEALRDKVCAFVAREEAAGRAPAPAVLAKRFGKSERTIRRLLGGGRSSAMPSIVEHFNTGMAEHRPPITDASLPSKRAFERLARAKGVRVGLTAAEGFLRDVRKAIHASGGDLASPAAAAQLLPSRRDGHPLRVKLLKVLAEHLNQPAQVPLRLAAGAETSDAVGASLSPPGSSVPQRTGRPEIVGQAPPEEPSPADLEFPRGAAATIVRPEGGGQRGTVGGEATADGPGEAGMQGRFVAPPAGRAAPRGPADHDTITDCETRSPGSPGSSRPPVHTRSRSGCTTTAATKE